MPTGQNDFATLTPAVERENYTAIGPGKYDPHTSKQIGSLSQLSTTKNDACFSISKGKREQHHTKMIQSKDQAIESIGRHSPGAGRYESVNLDKIQLKSFAHQKKVGQIFGRDRRVSMFENILQEVDDTQLFYDYKVEKKRVIGHGFGSSTRFTLPNQKNFSRVRNLSTLDVSRGSKMELEGEVGVKTGKHSRAVSQAGNKDPRDTKLPEIFNKLSTTATKAQAI